MSNGQVKVTRSIYSLILIMIVFLLLPVPVAAQGAITGSFSVELVISNIFVSYVSNSGSVIYWQTNGYATSRVFFDTHSYTNHLDYSQRTTQDDSLVIEHSQVLSGLKDRTRYYFQIESAINIAGIDYYAYSTEGSFMTTAPPVSLAHSSGKLTNSYPLNEYQCSPGVFKSDTVIQSDDQQVSLSILQGTNFSEADGKAGIYITIEPVSGQNAPALPLGGNIIGVVYNLGPQGCTFDPPIVITLPYYPEGLPKEIDERSLVIGYWDNASQHWIELPDIKVDTQKHTVSASLSHFTPYAVLYKPELTHFSIKEMAVSQQSVITGQEVIITLTVNNSGISSGDYTLNLMIDGQNKESRKILLGPGASHEVRFRLVAGAAGTYEINLNGTKAQLTVKSSSGQTPEALLGLSNLSISPEKTQPGNRITISAHVENTNENEATRKISLNLNNSVIENRIITVAGKSSQQISFTTYQSQPGRYEIGLEGLSGSFTITAPVIAPAFVISDLKISPGDAVPQQNVAVSAVLANIGNLQGIWPVSLKVNGKVIETQEITLEGNTSQKVSFNFSTDKIGTSLIQINDQFVCLSIQVPPVFTILYEILVGICTIALIVLLIMRKRIGSSKAAV